MNTAMMGQKDVRTLFATIAKRNRIEIASFNWSSDRNLGIRYRIGPDGRANIVMGTGYISYRAKMVTLAHEVIESLLRKPDVKRTADADVPSVLCHVLEGKSLAPTTAAGLEIRAAYKDSEQNLHVVCRARNGSFVVGHLYDPLSKTWEHGDCEYKTERAARISLSSYSVKKVPLSAVVV